MERASQISQEGGGSVFAHVSDLSEDLGEGGKGILRVPHAPPFLQIRTRAEDIIQRASNHKRAHAAAGPIAGAGEGCDLVAESGEKGEGEGV